MYSSPYDSVKRDVYKRQLEGSEVSFPYKMGTTGYFLLDDQRENGSDSRAFGELTEDDLLGKVVYVLRRRGI